jgi:hypothetical protein
MIRADVLAHAEAMYSHLEDAYQIAGELRDVFSAKEWEESAGDLKDVCNAVRTHVQELRYLRSFFIGRIENTEEAK